MLKFNHLLLYKLTIFSLIFLLAMRILIVIFIFLSVPGATAVILSCMCLLFIAFIGIAYFFSKQKKDKIMAKVAADIENQREK